MPLTRQQYDKEMMFVGTHARRTALLGSGAILLDHWQFRLHCKNFSLIDSGNGEYVLAPAYDLLAVLLADPADTEEMAMSFTVGGLAWYLAACWPRSGTWHN